MDTMAAYARGLASKGKEQAVFDWDKAAQILKDRKADYAEAGLEDDWGCTVGGILLNGSIPSSDYPPYLSSNWATPQLRVDDEYIDCYKMQSEVPDWGADTFWPDSARKIFNED